MIYPCRYPPCPRTYDDEADRDHHEQHCTERSGNPRCARPTCQETGADIGRGGFS